MDEQTGSREVTRPRAGADDRWVEALYRDHHRRLIGLAAAITLDPDAAPDIVHDAFAGLQRHQDRVENPIGYLRRSVVNLSVSRLRRRRLTTRIAEPTLVEAGLPEIDETWAVVSRLPARQRAVVVLRFWEDLTVDSIAVTLGWPPGSVKSTLHRALEALRAELGEEGSS